MLYIDVHLKTSKTLICKDICTFMLIAALCKVAKTWGQPKCALIQLKKMWSTQTTECYSAIRKDEILPFATTWMDLENIILSKLSQREKAKNHMISLICSIETETHRYSQWYGGYQREGGAVKGSKHGNRR